MNTIPKTESAGGFVFNTNGGLLLVKEYGKYWGLPRGHVNEGEDKYKAAVREIEEETGLTDLEYIADLGSYSRSTFGEDGQPNNKELKIITFFYFKTIEFNLVPHDPDITDADWFEVNEARSKLINEDDINFFNRSIDKIRKLRET